MNLDYSSCCFSSDSGPHSRLILLEVTSRCNFRCSYCHARAERQRDMPFGLDKVSRIIEELHGEEFRSLIISGGEPLLYPRLEFVLRAARDSGFKLDLCTNGMLVNKVSIEMLSRYLDGVTVTLDTVDAMQLERMKGRRGVLSPILDGIKQLLSNGINATVTIVVTRTNLDTIERTVSTLHGIGVRSVTLQGLYDGGTNCDVHLRDTDRQFLYTLLSDTQSKIIDTGFRVRAKGIVVTQRTITACRAAESIMGIDAEGYLVPCILLRMQHDSLDLNRVRVRDAISSDVLQGFVGLKKRLACVSCPHDSKCAKGCVGAGYMKYRQLLPDIRCIA